MFAGFPVLDCEGRKSEIRKGHRAGESGGKQVRRGGTKGGGGVGREKKEKFVRADGGENKI